MAQRKHELEKLEEPQGPQAALVNNPSPYDTEVLREFGLEDVAGQLEREVHAQEEPAGESGREEGEEGATEGA
jgi:hypothetical protein